MVYVDLVGISISDIVFSSGASSLIVQNNANGKKFLIHVSSETGALLRNLLKKQTSKRPHTFTLLSNCITSLGATIQTIVIDDTFEGVFFAKIILNNKGTSLCLDARPSDAIALAIVNSLPILATSTLIEKLSWIDAIPSDIQTPNTSFLCR
ncbi:MAG: bifunctional nuclease family protein [Puniceicoccales bacterium]|jgi:bifunctional DNase/RNase|nr:bifunctional nuclease family protein [Puniceicoccales bacterium]